MSEAATREPHRLIAATVGVAIPRDRNTYGYLSEHHSFGESEDIAGDYAEELAAEMLATTLGLEFDPDKSWDEKKEVYRFSNEIVRTQNVTQTAVGDKKGLWTTVVAAAVARSDWLADLESGHSGPARNIPNRSFSDKYQYAELSRIYSALAAAFVVVSASDRFVAQTFEDVGTRAQGMARCVRGRRRRCHGGLVESGGVGHRGALQRRFRERSGDRTRESYPNQPCASSRGPVLRVALAVLGFSYYRLRVSQIAPPTTGSSAETDKSDGARAHSRALSQFGVTIDQALVDHLVVGATLKLVRAGEGGSSFDAWTDDPYHVAAISMCRGKPRRPRLGCHGGFRTFGSGLTVRNLLTAEFGDGADRFELETPGARRRGRSDEVQGADRR